MKLNYILITQISSKNQIRDMSITITMTPAIDNAVKEMIASALEQQLVALSEKYKFDVEEGREVININDIKFVKGCAVSPKKETKKEKKEKNKDKVKKAMSGYMLFSKENRESVTEKAKSVLKEGEKYQASETLKKLGAMWSALSKEEQVKWNEKAHAMKGE